MNSKNEQSKSISLKGVGKAYRNYKSKREVVKNFIAGNNEKPYELRWVLKDIDFELEKGEAVGVIGKNGCGKSTLLQLVCGTTRPTKGIIEVNGKIAALLELGSGFNPEYTGLENVYLNSTLLGMKKDEILNKMDNILGFADIGESIYQPVRTYSSGMVVRLAFAVIANIEADILIIDEALAVGDAFFTQKCMRFIQRFREDKSLLFVSHDPAAVQNLCDKAIYLANGKIQRKGDPKKIIEYYTKQIQQTNNSIKQEKYTRAKEEDEDKEVVKEMPSLVAYKRQWVDYRLEAIRYSDKENLEIMTLDKKSSEWETYGAEKAEVIEVKLTNFEEEERIQYISGGEIVKLTILARANENIEKMIVGFIIKNDKGLTILGDNTYNSSTKRVESVERDHKLLTEFIFSMPLLTKGEYSVCVSLASGDQTSHSILHWVNDALIINSDCSKIAAGIAGIPMHYISQEII